MINFDQPTAFEITMAAQKLTSDNWGYPPFNRTSFQNVQSLFPTVRIRRGDHLLNESSRDEIDLSGFTYDGISGAQTTLSDMIANSYTDAFLVAKDGVILTEQYFNNMSASSFHLMNSVSKSFLGILIGGLVDEGTLDTTKLITDYIPEFEDTAFKATTLQHALDMTGAVKYGEDYTNTDADFWQETAVVGWRPALITSRSAETLFDYAKSLKDTEQDDGSHFHYRTVFTNVLAMVVARASHESVQDLLETRVWNKLEPEQDAAIVCDRSGFPYFGAGMNACARDLMRFGQMIAQGGQYNENRVVSSAWIDDLVEGNDRIRQSFAESDYGALRPGGHYHNQFWGSAPGEQVATCIGIHGQFIHVDLSSQVVIVKLSSQPDAADASMFTETFLAMRALSNNL